MRHALRAFALGVALIAGGDTRAQGQFSIYGAGSQSCGTWTAEQNESSRRQRQAWVLGYLSAYNFYSPEGNAVKPADNSAIVAWMNNYCASHPLELIVNAVVVLVNEMRIAKGLPAFMPTLRH